MAARRSSKSSKGKGSTEELGPTVVVAVVRHGGRLLVLRRRVSKAVDAGLWEFVSGLVPGLSPPWEAAAGHVRHLVGVTARLVRRGEPFEISDDRGARQVHPFLFEIDAHRPGLRLDMPDHSEVLWIRPADLDRLDTVPGIARNLDALGLGASA